MDKNKTIAICFFVGAICFYIAAAIIFLNRNISNTIAIGFLCIGSSFLAVGGTFSNMDNNKDDDNSSNNQEK